VEEEHCTQLEYHNLDNHHNCSFDRPEDRVVAMGEELNLGLVQRRNHHRSPLRHGFVKPMGDLKTRCRVVRSLDLSDLAATVQALQ